MKLKTTIHACSITLLCGLVLAATATQRLQAEAPRASLVTVQAGSMPLILSAPHGGSQPILDVQPRRGEGVRSFKTATDTRTGLLTEKLADAIEKKTGKRPYVVIARFHRKYLDANRRERNAFESENARAPYAAYHGAIAQARRDVVARWGHGLLLDVHGQASKPAAIIRGTQNGRTTTHLINRFGRNSLTGKSSLFGQLARQGFPVIPAVESTAAEPDAYDGGYIVTHHGSRLGGTVDAIQLELGKDLRSTAAIPSTVDKLSTAIIAFAQDYLPQTTQAVATASGKQSDGKQPDGKVRVGLYVDKGTGSSLTALKKALAKFKNLAVHQLTAVEIRSGALNRLDVLIQPGGSGGGQGRHLAEEGRQQIRKFVKSGGGYIGICAGAYLASADYSWSLNILDAKVLDRRHWARGTGMVDVQLTKDGQRLLHSRQAKLHIYYGQGPLLAPQNRDDIEDYETVGTYTTEIAKNGAPAGVMKGTTAMAHGRYGAGQVFCFSPHPELTEGLESLLHHAINNVRRPAPETIVPR